MTQPNQTDMAAMFAALQAQAAQQGNLTPPPAPYGGYQQMPQGFTPPPAQPVQRTVAGNLAAMFEQPNTGVGPGVKLNAQTPIGTTVLLQVRRDVGDADIAQQTAPGTDAPVFRKDGSPVFRMLVPVSNLTEQGADQGLYVSGGLWTNLNDAMHRAGYPSGTAPKTGDGIKVTITDKNTNAYGTVSNRFDVQYVIAEGNLAAPVTPATQPDTNDAPVADTPPWTAEQGVRSAVAEFVNGAPNVPAAQQSVDAISTVAAQGGLVATAQPPAPVLDPAAAALLDAMTGGTATA